MRWSRVGFGPFGERERVCVRGHGHVRIRVRADAVLMRAPFRC